MTPLPTAATPPHTILIVDNTPANLGVVVESLEDRGFQVVVAQDGEEGLQRADFVQPDLILLDVMMPGLDGFEVCRRLKVLASTRDIPGIFMTSLTETENKITAFQAGGVDYVKLLQIDEVMARVSTHLHLHAMQQQLEAQNAQLQREIIERRQAKQALEASNELVRRQRDELKDLYDKIVAQQKASERLLLNLLPSSIAERLKARSDLMADSFPEIIAASFQEVTVLFADLVEFTQFSAGMSPECMVAVLNEIFTDFDGIADHRGLEKIKTIGDAYMASAGLPVSAADHAVRAEHMALDMMDALERFNARSGYRLQLRIGINSGPVVAGVIGKRKFIYDLWRDAVNTASRMESHGVAGYVQVTDATRQRLGEPFRFEERGIIDAKGIGALHTWSLSGRGSVSPNDRRALQRGERME